MLRIIYQQVKKKHMSKERRIRIYLDEILVKDREVSLSRDHSHYLLNVMRCREGEKIRVFNQEYGEWDGVVEFKGRNLVVRPHSLIKNYEPRNKTIILAFAPTKKYGEFSVEKATEMGVDCIIPIKCERSVVNKINYDRYKKAAVEAAEQCGRIDLPKISDMVRVYDLKDKVQEIYQDEEVQFMLCDIGGESNKLANGKVICIIVGPEGGFGNEDYKVFNQLEVNKLNLGDLVLRAETACVAAVATVKVFSLE